MYITQVVKNDVAILTICETRSSPLPDIASGLVKFRQIVRIILGNQDENDVLLITE